MSLTHNGLSSNILLALLATLLLLIPNGKADAQYNPRVFQTAFFENPAAFATFPTGADVDIRSFEGSVQPVGFSIYQSLGPMSTLPPPCAVPPVPNTTCYDWSRIVAVEIDEPYVHIDGELDETNCTPTAPDSNIEAIDTALSKLASKLKTMNPKARFWVNFTPHEAEWMQFCAMPQVLNRAYMDVISVDWYDSYLIDDLASFYSTVIVTPASPHQQIAFVPGVFSAPSDQSGYWQSYFDYANYANQTCNLPLGSQGVTGIFDGCQVWLVMGWLTGDFTDPTNGTAYKGILDGSQGSQTDRAKWQSVVADTPGPVLLRARGSIANYFRPSLNLLLQ